MARPTVLAALATLLLAAPAAAQTQLITLDDGTEHFGEVYYQGDTAIITTPSGQKIKVAKARIKGSDHLSKRGIGRQNPLTVWPVVKSDGDGAAAAQPATPTPAPGQTAGALGPGGGAPAVVPGSPEAKALGKLRPRGATGGENTGGIPQQLTMAQIQAIQTRIMTDPELMETVMSLADDPQLMQAVMDPSLLAAVQRGDTAAAAKNPAFRRVANDPRVRKLMKALAAEMGRTR